jgi:hypothetical protein
MDLGVAEITAAVYRPVPATASGCQAKVNMSSAAGRGAAGFGEVVVTRHVTRSTAVMRLLMGEFCNCPHALQQIGQVQTYHL